MEDPERFREMIKERMDLGVHATYHGNIRYHVYNWFYYKEAFSRGLVLKIIKEFGLKKGIVLDPFCGSGTTLLACKEMGIDSIGFDIQPSAVNAANAKVLDYDAAEAKKVLKYVLSKEIKKTAMQRDDFSKKAFSDDVWKQVAFYISEISGLPSHLKPFFRLALTRAAVRASSCLRDGAVIKFGKKKHANVKRLLKAEAGWMLKGYKIFARNSKDRAYSKAFFGNSLNIPLKSGSLDAVMTSPPYIGQADYLTAYELENLFAGKKIEENFLGSASDRIDENVLSLPVPASCLKYFSGLNASLEEISRVCKKRAKAAIVIGNGHVDRKIVESDIVTACLAERAGFEVRGIYALNRRFALVKRTKKAGVLRESLLILEKN